MIEIINDRIQKFKLNLKNNLYNSTTKKDSSNSLSSINSVSLGY